VTNSVNPRWIAVQAILQVLDQGRSLDEIFNSDWYQSLVLEKRDRALSRELVFGFCRWYFALSTLLASRLQKPLRARDRDIEVILILGLYQLLVMNTDPHAAVNETVKLALAQKKSWARGLVNALLRGVIRDKIVLDSSSPAQAYPDWIMSRIRRDWGEQAEQVLIQGNNRPPMTLRVDTRQASIDNVIASLRSAGIEADRYDVVATAIELSSPCEVSQLPGFEQGILSVQDAAAQIAASVLACRSGARVLDACAAPGGKTAHLLQQYEDIKLDALDSSEVRLERLRQNLQRIDKSARILIGDAASPEAWFDGDNYDCILWRLLKPGGKMLYSTCSVFKDENEVQIAKFLERHPDCAEITINNAEWGEARPHGRQILTGSDNMDGFYYGLLTRSGGE
jgi:16S rRNA (cytosine967-C5)-methyltransferase